MAIRAIIGCSGEGDDHIRPMQSSQRLTKLEPTELG
jgi:hypothetical protein